MTLINLLNRSGKQLQADLLKLPFEKGSQYYDAWNGARLAPKRVGNEVVIQGRIDRIGCIAVLRNASPGLSELLAANAREAIGVLECGVKNKSHSVNLPKPIERTAPARRSTPPAGMVYVPGGPVPMKIRHQRRECGCYPDPGTPKDKEKLWLFGTPEPQGSQQQLLPRD